MLNKSLLRKLRKELYENRKSWPVELKQVPREQWPPEYGFTEYPVELWRSKTFLVQVFRKNNVERLSVSRCELEAVEVYPPDVDVVNVANIRHLWIPPEGMPFTWKSRGFKRPASSDTAPAPLLPP